MNQGPKKILLNGQDQQLNNTIAGAIQQERALTSLHQNAMVSCYSAMAAKAFEERKQAAYRAKVRELKKKGVKQEKIEEVMENANLTFNVNFSDCVLPARMAADHLIYALTHPDQMPQPQPKE